MKKLKLTLLFLAIALLVSGCSINFAKSATSVVSPVYPKGIDFDDYSSRLAVIEQNMPDEAFLNALDDFAKASSANMLSGDGKNQLFSPLSLYYPLALCSVGAEGETRSQLLEALQLEGFDDDYITEQSAKLFRCLFMDNEVSKLKLANSLWLDEFSFKKDFLDTAGEEFYASLHEADFSKDSTKKEMAKWVSEKTGGLIKPEYDLPEDLVLMIMNTIYFKDAWSNSFSENLTKTDDFTLSDGTVVKADFMNKTSIRSYIDGDGWSLLSMGTKGGATMNFVLPDEGVIPQELLSLENLSDILESKGESISAELTVALPKYDFSTESNLTELLTSLGITDALNPALADFSNMAEDNTFISSARQLTRITIDEDGVEAAAYTEVGIDTTSMPPPGIPVELIFDRPFIFFIEYQGVTLFVGVVSNPTAN